MKHLTQAQRIVGLVAILVVGVAIAYAAAQYGQSLSELPSSTPPTATEPAPGAVGDGGCVIGGCSGELCTEAGDEPAISTCIYRPEYACYASSTCARQANGSCGWTQTAAFTSCLDNPPSAQ